MMANKEFFQNKVGAICLIIDEEQIELTYDQVKGHIDCEAIDGFNEDKFFEYYNLPGKDSIHLDDLIVREFSTTKDIMYSGSKKRDTGAVSTRQMYMKILKERTNLSLSGIGKLIKTPVSPEGMSHSNVIHAIKAVKNDIDTDSYYRDIYERINKEIDKNKVIIPS